MRFRWGLVLMAAGLLWCSHAPQSFAYAADRAASADTAMTWPGPPRIVRIAVDPHWQPLEYIDNQQPKGLSIAYLDKVAQRAGLLIKFVPTASWDESVHKLLAGEVDLLPAMPDLQLPVEAENRILLTQPYYVGMTLIVAGAHDSNFFDLDSLGCITVALKADGAYQHWMAKHAPACTRILPLPSDAAALEAVSHGQAMAAIGPDAILRPIIRRHDRTLHVAGAIAELPLVLRMAVRHDAQPLLDALNQALASLSAQDTDAVFQEWVEQADYGSPSVGALWHYYRKSIAILAVVIACLGLAIYQARRAQRAALQSERAKAEFLAIMSHEIRTPLNAVIAALELLALRQKPAKQTRLLSHARASAEALLALLNNALDYSRLESGTISLEAIPTDISALANSVLASLRVTAQQKKLALRLQDRTQGQWLYLDPTRVSQLLMNLLGNAIKFTEHGHVTLHLDLVRPTASPSDTATLYLSVLDSGIGISQADQGHLFQPFTQAERSTARRFGGTGLGLSICHKLVQAMHGQITLQSTVGHGSEFKVSLPVRIAPSPLSEHVDEPAETFSAGSELRILVVEDTEANQIVLAEQLRALGYVPQVASNGQQALQAFDTQSFAAILMDCHLPGTTGYEIARQIRFREQTNGQSAVPIIAISADVGPEHTASCLEAGMDGVLSKPIRISNLRETLHMWTHTYPVAADTDIAPAYQEHTSVRDMLESSTLMECKSLSQAMTARQRTRCQHHLHRIKGILLIIQQSEVLAEVQQFEQLLFANKVNWAVLTVQWQHLEPQLLETARIAAHCELPGQSPSP
jgi:two-component system, NarL family, sensor histidine kinase EvgS